MRQERGLALSICFGLPAGVLLVAFGAICLKTGTLWPWARIVHEDGTRTLLETIFFFEHAARELPLDVLLGMAVAAGMLRFHPLGLRWTGPSFERHRRLLQWVLVMTMAATGIILLGTILSSGGRVLLQNLTQMLTRVGVPPVWGRHWRYHVLERLAMLCLAVSGSGLLPVSSRAATRHTARAASRLLAVSFTAFGALTLLFGLSWEPVRDPVFLGHQARELLTHTLVTLPLSLGVCTWLARRISHEPMGSPERDSTRVAWITGTCGLCLAGYVLIGALLTGGVANGQTRDLVPLVFAHFFEHSFTYLLVPLVAATCYLWGGLRSAPPEPTTPDES